jgi:hypothetical protein
VLVSVCLRVLGLDTHASYLLGVMYAFCLCICDIVWLEQTSFLANVFPPLQIIFLLSTLCGCSSPLNPSAMTLRRC